MSRKIIAISANTTPIRWVSETYKRPGNQLGVEYTTDKNQAMDFGSEGYANSVIPRINNPFERTFKVEQVTVAQPDRIMDFMGESKLN